MEATSADALAQLKLTIANREARIGIIGMGYVGLPLALLFSDERLRVTGFDIAADKVATLNSGGSYDYGATVAESQMVVDTRNATKGIDAPHIVRC